MIDGLYLLVLVGAIAAGVYLWLTREPQHETFAGEPEELPALDETLTYHLCDVVVDHQLRRGPR